MFATTTKQNTSEPIHAQTVNQTPARVLQDHTSSALTLQRHLLQMQNAEEEELLQGKFAQITESHAPVHRKVDPTTTVNGVAVNDDPGLEHEADVMGAQAASFTPTAIASGEVAQQEKAPNNTGLPDNLKAGIENMSGMSMEAVKVHYNSEKPAQLNALAYAQGTDIHVGPGQEQHLPHEAWHVVQQGEDQHAPMQCCSVNDDFMKLMIADDMEYQNMLYPYIANIKFKNPALINYVVHIHLDVTHNTPSGYKVSKNGNSPIHLKFGEKYYNEPKQEVDIILEKAKKCMFAALTKK